MTRALGAQKHVLDNGMEKVYGSVSCIAYGCFLVWKETTADTNKEYKGLLVQLFCEDEKSCISIPSCWQCK